MTGTADTADPWNRRSVPWLLSLTMHVAVLAAVAQFWRAAQPPLSVVPIQIRLATLPPPAPEQQAQPKQAAAPLPEAAPPVTAPAPPMVQKPLPLAPEASSPPALPAVSPSPAPAIPPAAAGAAPHAPAISITPQEVTRGGGPGMITEPLAPAAPLTRKEWDRLAKSYHTGDDQQGQVEAQRGPDRASRSKRVARLTEEEYAKLAKSHHTGNDQQGMVEAMIGPVRAARSERSPPLTNEEYAAQTKIYWTGLDNGGTTPVEREAGLRGALSFQASLVSPAAQVDYSNRSHAPNSDRMAVAMAQPPPALPSDLSLAKPAVVVARFEIAEDGSFAVTLTDPTSEPRLNDALLAAFDHWRFAPAYRSGRPVASTVDYRLTIAPSLAVRVVSTVKLLETQNQAEFARRGTPAAPIETPPPDLPPALLRPGAQWNAVLRVHVARDGTAEATVTTPAADPAVTSAVQAVVRRWRFRPTFVRGAQPEDSTIELSLTVSVSS